MAGYLGFMGRSLFSSKESWEKGDMFHYYDIPIFGVFTCVSSPKYFGTLSSPGELDGLTTT